MSAIKRFNPYEMSAATLRAIATGRERSVARIVATVARNAECGPMQHLQIVAPRGYGKSFLLCLVRDALAAGDLPVRVAMLPEEQANVDAPHRLLDEISRILAGRAASTLMGSAFRVDAGAWEASVAALDGEIATALPEGGLVVAMVENFDALLGDVFRKPLDQSRLRAWLARPGGRVMLLASSTRQADAKYEQRLFHATGVMVLDPWQEAACEEFFGKLRGLRQAGPMPDAMLAKARAVAQFIGGSPRMATVLGEVLESQDSLQAAGVLDAVIDELTPYYKHRVESLPRQSRSVLDALLRGGEPATQSELARRLGVEQRQIARPFAELHRRGEVVGERAVGSAEMLYRVGDRLMAHYYRKRHFGAGEGESPLEAIAEFLARFFTTKEKWAEAERLRGMGRVADAEILERLAGAEGGWPDWLEDVGSRVGELVEQGRAAEAVTCAREAVARAGGDAGGLPAAVAMLELCWSLAHAGDFAKSAPVARQAIVLAEKAGNLHAQLYGARHLGLSLGLMGDHAGAVVVLRRAVDLADKAGNFLSQAEGLRLLGLNLGQMGDPYGELTALRRAVALAERTPDPSLQSKVMTTLAFRLGSMGNNAEALVVVRRAITLAEQAGDEQQIVAPALVLCHHVEQVGAHDEAVESWLRAVGIVVTGPQRYGMPNPYIWLHHATLAALRCGRFAEVWRAAVTLTSRSIPDDVAVGIAEAIAKAAEEGRAAGYGLAGPFFEVLVAEGGVEAVALMEGVVGQLIPRLADPGLLRDIAALLGGRVREMLEAAALRREAPGDPAALQRVDPDIARAVDRMLGVELVPPKAPRRRAARGTARKT